MVIRFVVATIVAIASLTLFAAETAQPSVEHISALTNNRRGSPLKLTQGEAATTKATFKPPVEILIEAKTDSTNLRLSYAADQVIFNWERGRQQLRVDGGPADGKHKSGAGTIPTNRYVVVRWVVIPTRQSIYVDDQLRFGLRATTLGASARNT